MARACDAVDGHGHPLERTDPFETRAFFPGAPGLIAGRPELSAETERENPAGGATRVSALPRPRSATLTRGADHDA